MVHPGEPEDANGAQEFLPGDRAQRSICKHQHNLLDA